MNKTILKSKINGCISAPSSKSSLQRHIVASMLASGKSTIKFETISADVENVLRIADNLTSSAKIIGKSIEIQGGIIKNTKRLNVGESGLGLRMLTPILCTTDNRYEISGQGSLINRSIDFIIESLQKAGAKIKSNNGKLPIIIESKITNSSFTIDGSLSSQVLTGLLMAAPLLNKKMTILVENLNSKPYIDLTINILQQYGIKIINNNYKQFVINSMQKYKPVHTKAEGDWSGSAFILVAAAIAGKVTVKDIERKSKQGDKRIVDVLKRVGAQVEQTDNQITIIKNKLNAFEFDATDTPDLFPPLVALAVNCEGISKIKGIGRLKHKESNRANTLKSEFEKLSANITLNEDYMQVKGGKLKGNIVNSHNDHRIAMALTTAALAIEEKVTIEKSEAVEKSWVGFFDSFKKIGAKIY